MAACSIDLILNAEVSGTTSTNIGSARIITGSNTQASFRAMMGTSTLATASVEVKRFTGATSILKLNTAGIGLQDVSGSQRTIGNSAVTGSWATGKVDSYSLNFDGTDDLVDVGTDTIVPAGGNNYTVSVWINIPDTISGHREIMSQWTVANVYQSFFLGTTDTDNIRFSDSWDDIDIGAWTTDAWHHLVAISTTTNAYIYFDGALEATKGSALGYTGTGNLLIGKQGEYAGEYWKGSIDEVGVWDVALSASDVAILYNSGDGAVCSSVSSSNLSLYYDMEGGPGASILTDRTGNGNNGTLTNMETGSLLLVDDWYDFYASGSAADVSTLVKGIRVILQ